MFSSNLLLNSQNSRAVASPPHFSGTGVREEDLAGHQTGISPHLSLVNPATPRVLHPCFQLPLKAHISQPLSCRHRQIKIYLHTTRCIRMDNHSAMPKLRSRAAPTLSGPALKAALTMTLVFGPELAHWG